MSDTDTLANLLAEHESRDNYDDGEYIGYICKCRAPESGPYDTDHAAHVAVVVAESGWLAEARADAWQEGHIQIAPHSHPKDWTCNCVGIYTNATCPNPYRTTEDNTTDRT